MPFELQHSDIPQPTYEPATEIGRIPGTPLTVQATITHHNVPLFPAIQVPVPFDPERADDGVMPPVKRWEPGSGFELDAMCEEAKRRLASKLDYDVDLHMLCWRFMWGSSHADQT